MLLEKSRKLKKKHLDKKFDHNQPIINRRSINSTIIADEDTWTQWTSWSSCSATCGPGTRVRRRTCQPPPVADAVALKDAPRRVNICPGNNEEFEKCEEKSCPRGRRKKWSGWGPFSSCSSTCEGGTQLRHRRCEGERGECFGSPTDIQPCGQV